jgi:hypothetical protein
MLDKILYVAEKVICLCNNHLQSYGDIKAYYKLWSLRPFLKRNMLQNSCFQI